MLFAPKANTIRPPDFINEVIRNPQLGINEMFVFVDISDNANHMLFHTYGIIRGSFSCLNDRHFSFVAIEKGFVQSYEIADIV